LGINVLSCFDGISAGQLALQRAGIKVDNYYASEIDKYAIEVTQKNYPETIQLGNIDNWEKWDLPKIDLLIGGSPCQGFSSAGKGLNFDDPRSKLFFTFVDILKKLNPKYFLLENVKMKKEWQNIISEYTSVNPVMINSSLVSAQERERLYWTNIQDNILQPKDKNIMLMDILEKPIHFDDIKNWCYGNYCGTPRIEILRSINNQKSFAITTNSTHNKHYYVNETKTKLHHLTSVERERLQTFPDGYTLNISKTQRNKALGNSWTVDVIAHIFSYLPKEFKKDEL
jgi:DNA (cytosine-5)-methyltransferase 3A